MTATDWDTPQLTDEYSDFRDFIKTQMEHLGLMDFTDDTNIPTGFVRLNPTTEAAEKYTGASWTPTLRETEVTNHMNNSSLHGGLPIGSIFAWLTGTAPDNCFFLDGAAKSRTTYADLFALWGTSFGSGDGSTTFGIPDCRGQLLIGKSSTSPANGSLGATFGDLNHVHSGPSHTHTVASHTHTLSAHTHTGGSHVHTTPDHSHTVPAHYHAATGNGADINISSSGSHTHTYGAKEGGSDGSTANRAQGASSTSGSNVSYTTTATGSTHVHSNSEFAGRVGNVSGAINGDGTMTSGTANGGNTGSGGAVATGAPSADITSGTSLTTDAGGTANSGAGNPPCIIVNWCVKAL